MLWNLGLGMMWGKPHIHARKTFKQVYEKFVNRMSILDQFFIISTFEPKKVGTLLNFISV